MINEENVIMYHNYPENIHPIVVGPIINKTPWMSTYGLLYLNKKRKKWKKWK